MIINQAIKFAVPALFSNGTLYKRVGAMIIDRATGKIAGHVQEVASLGFESLPIPGGNILGLAMKGIQTFQLQRIQQAMNTMMLISGVGAVASVATLGVSIAGFAMMSERLTRMDKKLDSLLQGNAEVHSLARRLNVKFDAVTLAQLNASLENLSFALVSTNPDRRRTMIHDSISELAKLRHYYASLLATQEFSSRTSDELVALVDAEERLVAACQGELVGEFFLGDDANVLAERRKSQQELFARLPWSTDSDLFDFVSRADRRARVDLTYTPEERAQRVSAVAQIRAESAARLDSTVTIANSLHRRGIDFNEYRRQVSDRAALTGELALVIDASGD